MTDHAEKYASDAGREDWASGGHGTHAPADRKDNAVGKGLTSKRSTDDATDSARREGDGKGIVGSLKDKLRAGKEVVKKDPHMNLLDGDVDDHIAG